MLACDAYLAADFLLQHGFVLVEADGRRWASRDGLRFEIEPACGCCLSPDVEINRLEEAA